MTHDEFIKQSKKLVSSYVNNISNKFGDTDCLPSDVFIVWSVKVVKNSKAIMGTPFNDGGLIFEISLNNEKEEIYFDVYKKEYKEIINY